MPSRQKNQPSVPKKKAIARISKKDHGDRELGKRTAAKKTRPRRRHEAINGRAGFTRNHQCLRITRRTSSSGCCPEKCHFLSRPRRKFCQPKKRGRPDRQRSSWVTVVPADFFSCTLLLMFSPRYIYNSNFTKLIATL